MYFSRKGRYQLYNMNAIMMADMNLYNNRFQNNYKMISERRMKRIVSEHGVDAIKHVMNDVLVSSLTLHKSVIEVQNQLRRCSG